MSAFMVTSKTINFLAKVIMNRRFDLPPNVNEPG